MPAEQIHLDTYEIRNCTLLGDAADVIPGAAVSEAGAASTCAASTARAAVRIKDGIIEAVEYGGSPGAGPGHEASGAGGPTRANEPAPVIDVRGACVVPGLVELHIHGCGEAGVEESVGRPEILEHTARFLSAYGINTFLPTLPCSEDAVGALAGILESNPKLRKRIPGIYVEGPFVNPDKRGGISPALIRKPDPGILDRIIDLGRGYIKMMTVAPELPGAERVIERLLEKDIVPCLGHSDCTAAEALSIMRRAAGREPEAAEEAARFNITHLFNGMSGLSHKRPGLAAVPFLEEECYFELNGDGIHVADEVLSIAHRHLRKDRMILISDAVVSAGLAYGDYSYFGNEVVSDEHGVRYAENGVLIGSNRLIPGVCSHFSRATGCSAAEVLAMVTENPRRLLGLGENWAVRPGMKADLVAIDDSFEVLFNFWGY